MNNKWLKSTMQGVRCFATMALFWQGAAWAVSTAELTPQSKTLEIQLPSTQPVSFELQAQHPEAHLTGLSGRTAQNDAVYLFFSGDRAIAGELFTSTGHYRLRAEQGALHWVHESKLLHHALDFSRNDVVKISKNGQLKSTPPMAVPDEQGLYTVDIFAVVTPLVVERFGTLRDAMDDIQSQLFLANSLYQNSGIQVRYRLLDAQIYTGTQEYVDAKRNIAVVKRDPAIAAWRDAWGADLVMFFRTPDGDSSLAIATLFNGEDKNDPPQDVNPERDAYTVVYAGKSESGFSTEFWITAHELGHNLAGGHNWLAHNVDGIYWQTDAHGFDCGSPDDGPHASIMSYGLGFSVAVIDNRLDLGSKRGDFFSSPAISRNNVPCGVSKHAGPEALQADNVRVINAAAPYVAAYRDAAVMSRESHADSRGGSLGLVFLCMCLLVLLNRNSKECFS